ncbi:MAG: RelA/SpoT family protein [Muribaculaceae bacterium]|nr:RelA/SpoT family protein [Muribaculaceae bacterium]
MNNATDKLTVEELSAATHSIKELLKLTKNVAQPGDVKRLKELLTKGIETGTLNRNRHGFHRLLHNIETARLMCEKIGPDREMVLAILLRDLCRGGMTTEEEVAQQWGTDVSTMIHGLLKTAALYSKSPAVASENFRNLLLTFAEDIRVILIMIVDRLNLMRAINHHPDEQFVKETAMEASYLYAPLAHRLGLYAIKSELEDLSLKYTNRRVYTEIARELNTTKVARDKYIQDFIAPVKSKLEQTGLKFSIKGRTKSISSIWNKILKQHNDLKHIYDLFAIRVILDVPQEREKAECWNVYSIITDMYTPNPARMKDWLSIPKSNGYESLHTTVYGPEGKWVEVQIRTRRMDEIAEKGLAAHWKYKGIKSEANLDTWMANVRDILEAGQHGPTALMKDMKMDVYNKEVFVFTPKGDLFKLPLGATVLDFAFNIHSKLGCQCIGGKVNGKNRKLNYKLHSGDSVEITTSANQQPKQDWLSMVVTSKARTKIRQTLNEQANRQADLGREMLQRRIKNRKLDMEEAELMKVIRKLGFKTVTDFFSAIGREELAVNDVVAEWEALIHKNEATAEVRSAEEFQLQHDDEITAPSNDVVIIGNNIKNINYKLSKCCNPIYGDDVFGFVSAEGVIKIHRSDCPNAAHIKRRYPERLITTRWSGKLGHQFAANLRIVGNDDLGIVTNISSIINKEKDVVLRNISIQANDGIFHGFLTVGVNTTESLSSLVKKLKTVKGVKDVQRSN